METNINEVVKLGKLLKLQNFSYNSETGTIDFLVDNTALFLEELNNTIKIEADSIGNKIRISVQQEHLNIFYDVRHLLSDVSGCDLEKNILVLNAPSEEVLIFDSSTEGVFSGLQLTKTNFLFSNLKSYFKFIDFLKDNDTEDDQPFHFVDHFNSTSNQIIFISVKKEGKLIIPFQKTRLNFDESKSLLPTYERFFEAFEDQNRNLPKFLKSEFFNYLSKVPKDDRMNELIDKMPEILHSAQQNFEIFLGDISIDKLKSDYQDNIEKYFSKIRELLGKLTSQTIAFPISITVAAYATFRITDSAPSVVTILLLLLITISFVVISFYTSFILQIQKDDVIDIRSSFEKEFATLENNEFFSKPGNGKETDELQESRNKLRKQATKFEFAINLYYWIQLTFNSLFVVFILFQLGLSLKWVLIIVIVLAICSYVLFRNLLSSL